MLPSVAPNARIMRYGYQSQWFGDDAIQQTVTRVAERFLRALKRERKVLNSTVLLSCTLLTRCCLGVSIPTLDIHSALLWWLGCPKGFCRINFLL